MRQIALDTETTGLDYRQGHRVIEVAGVELIDRRITRKHFHAYVNPQREVEQGAMAVHGITNEFLADKPYFSQIVDELLAFIDGAELIIHNAPFDVGFLNHEFRLATNCKGNKLERHCKIFDTLTYARELHPGQRNSLDALCKRYSVDNSARDLHGALLDSEILAQVYLVMTGGQSSLFAEEKSEANSMNAPIEIARVSTDREALAVVEPTASELAAHQDYVKKHLSNTEAASLWEQYE